MASLPQYKKLAFSMPVANLGASTLFVKINTPTLGSVHEPFNIVFGETDGGPIQDVARLVGFTIDERMVASECELIYLHNPQEVSSTLWKACETFSRRLLNLTALIAKSQREGVSPNSIIRDANNKHPLFFSGIVTILHYRDPYAAENFRQQHLSLVQDRVPDEVQEYRDETAILAYPVATHAEEPTA